MPAPTQPDPVPPVPRALWCKVGTPLTQALLLEDQESADILRAAGAGSCLEVPILSDFSEA